MPFPIFVYAIPAMIFFLRFLMQFTGCEYYNPICRTVATITSPFLKLTANINFLKPRKNAHLGALLWTFILGEIGYYAYFIIVNGAFFESVSAVIFILVMNFLFTLWAIINLFFILMIICGILSWIPPLAIWSMFFRRLVSPIIDPLDRFIPPIGVISLSFLVGFLLLSLTNYTAMPMLINKILLMLTRVL